MRWRFILNILGYCYFFRFDHDIPPVGWTLLHGSEPDSLLKIHGSHDSYRISNIFYFPQGLDYTDLEPAVIDLLANRSVGIQPHCDPNSMGYKRWLTAFQAFDPKGKHTQGKLGYDSEMKVLDSSGNPLFRHALASYDAAMVYFLAMTKADTTDNEKIRQEIIGVANPPGLKIYPGEFSKARGLILSGQDIDYEGASSPVNLDKSGNVSGLPYLVWSVNSDGAKKDLEVITP